ncbi:hypothetical protein WOLCODRAFT_76102 [Wolfiporia cocos MD-104 SS10]|uniref:AB hydrolase-1 domain-containing protein n=1 Tax=Wolfiporia cocos (strain MD-104) TaxID=742152 RepID=A0A2H3JP55_WOLCO|nr:hypothetical protein WOLCODRAFT_76102 [Wolfiporia cocos MD-104 SS10]
MPQAPVDDNGTVLSFQDSGAPTGASNYVTLVLVHGTVAHGAVFLPMFSFAAQYNIRLIALNLRNYPGSTPYSPGELAVIHGSDRRSQALFIRDRGLEIAAFLEWFLRGEHIPPISRAPGGAVEGGIVLLGWSFGNSMTLSFLANASDLTPTRQNLLGVYLRHVIIYDPVSYAIGIPPPPLQVLYDPTIDPSIPPDHLGHRFAAYVFGYYRHKQDILSSLASCTLEGICAGIVHHPEMDPKSTLARIPAEELATILDVDNATHVHIPMLNLDGGTHAENTRKALLETDVWPHVHATLIWCDMSVGQTVLAAGELHRALQLASSTGSRVVKTIRLEGANHFPHWDQPGHTMRILASVVNQKLGEHVSKL